MCFEFREVENIVDDGEQRLRRFLHGRRVLALHRHELRFEQQLAHADHAVHRRSDFVAHRGDELAFQARCLDRLIECECDLLGR